MCEIRAKDLRLEASCQAEVKVHHEVDQCQDCKKNHDYADRPEIQGRVHSVDGKSDG